MKKEIETRVEETWRELSENWRVRGVQTSRRRRSSSWEAI